MTPEEMKAFLYIKWMARRDIPLNEIEDVDYIEAHGAADGMNRKTDVSILVDGARLARMGRLHILLGYRDFAFVFWQVSIGPGFTCSDFFQHCTQTGEKAGNISQTTATIVSIYDHVLVNMGHLEIFPFGSSTDSASNERSAREELTPYFDDDFAFEPGELSDIVQEGKLAIE
eukprot:gene9851-772_t